ncbi:MAG: GNAT family N-acetyltransferase [Pararhizobium sp.]
MFDVTIENAFDFLSADYRDLFARSEATAFQHPVWLDALYRQLAPALQAKPLIVVIRRAGGLAMVLPLTRRRFAGLRVVEFADLRVSDYAAPVCDAETFAAILSDRALVGRIRASLKPYEMLRIAKLRTEGLPIEELLGIKGREAMGTNAYATPLAATFEDWQAASLQRSYVKELAKKSRQLHRRGNAVFGCAEGRAEVSATMQALQAFRGIRFRDEEDTDIMQLPAYFAFYAAVAEGGREAYARVYRLTMDGTTIAAALALVHRGAVHVVLSGFDQAGYGRQSVGNLLFEFIARDSIARGDTALDFTIGDEPYKLTFGATASPMWRVSRAGSPLGHAAGLLMRRMPAARSFARRIVHGAPSSAGTPASTAHYDEAANG